MGSDAWHEQRIIDENCEGLSLHWGNLQGKMLVLS
jgi:hypothetical protein